MDNEAEYSPYQEYANNVTWTPCWIYIPYGYMYYYPYQSGSIPAYPATQVARGNYRLLAPPLTRPGNYWQLAPPPLPRADRQRATPRRDQDNWQRTTLRDQDGWQSAPPPLAQDGWETESVGEVSSLAAQTDQDNDDYCINSVLPDELIVQVLTRLPIANIVSVTSVCKKWHQIITSGEQLVRELFGDSSHKPWYFMFASLEKRNGHVYDPAGSRWYRFEIQYLMSCDWQIASSAGLVCFRSTDDWKEIRVCNPITTKSRRLPDPPVYESARHLSLAFSTDEFSKDYIVALVTSKSCSEQFDRFWNIKIDVYKSEEKTWQSTVELMSVEFRGTCDSVICGRTLYFVVHFTSLVVENFDDGVGLLAYDLAPGSGSVDSSSLMESLIKLPCSKACTRLMNMKEKLVLVGGIERRRTGSVKGIVIWVLEGRDWIEVARAPPKFLNEFPELDNTFVCAGSAELIYIQSYGYEELLMYDMKLNEWRFARSHPSIKKGVLNRTSVAIDFFSGFCFEPRFDVAP